MGTWTPSLNEKSVTQFANTFNLPQCLPQSYHTHLLLVLEGKSEKLMAETESRTKRQNQHHSSQAKAELSAPFRVAGFLKSCMQTRILGWPLIMNAPWVCSLTESCQ